MKKIILLCTIFFYCFNFSFGQAGRLDSSFGNNGIVKTDFGFKQEHSYTSYTSFAVQDDGKLLAAGRTWSGSNYHFAIARYNIDGSLDTTFDRDGRQTTDIDSVDAYVFALKVENGGKILSAGAAGSDFALTRYNPDGSLNLSFGNNGKKVTNFNFGANEITTANAAVFQSDGKVVLVGSTYKPGKHSRNFAVARYNGDGTLDSSFSDDGKLTTNIGYNNADNADCVAIQNDGKIVVGGYSALSAKVGYFSSLAVVRYNSNGSLDSSFSDDGIQTNYFSTNEDEILIDDYASSITIQGDGKIVVGGSTLARYNTNGSLDSTFRAGTQKIGFGISSVTLQNDGKILAAGSHNEPDNDDRYFALARYNNDGAPDSTFSEDGKQITDISPGFESLNSITIADKKLYALGSGGNRDSSLGVVARYLLGDENKAPTVTLSIPNNIVKYAAPARIKLNAAVANVEGTVQKVQFYSDSTLLHTEDVSPYGFLWVDVPTGNYTLTAKAFDNSGNVITSNSITVSVADSNVAPVVSIVSPVADTTYTSPATIRIIANAKDPNDKISKVEFYNGAALLRTEYYYPYTYTWPNVQPGTYTITAVAYDDKGLSATSEPVVVTVTNPMAPIVSSRPFSINDQTDLNGALSMRLSPNPAKSTLRISTKGLQLNKASTISVISASGVVMKTINANALNQIVPLDVSSLISGVYTLKVISGGKVMYKQFVKL